MSARGHSLNNSPSKQKYSFGKDNRFTYEKPQYITHNKELMPIIFPQSTRIAEARSLAMASVRWELCRKIRTMGLFRTPMIFPVRSRRRRVMPLQEDDM